MQMAAVKRRPRPPDRWGADRRHKSVISESSSGLDVLRPRRDLHKECALISQGTRIYISLRNLQISGVKIFHYKLDPLYRPIRETPLRLPARRGPPTMLPHTSYSLIVPHTTSQSLIQPRTHSYYIFPHTSYSLMPHTPSYLILPNATSCSLIIIHTH